MTQRHNGHSLENVLKHEQSQSSNCLCVIVHFLSKFTHTFNQWQCAQMCIPKLAWVIRYGQQIWPPVADGITVHIVVQIYININIHVKKNSRYHNSASLCVWSKWCCNTDIVEIYWQESLCLKIGFICCCCFKGREPQGAILQLQPQGGVILGLFIEQATQTRRSKTIRT